MSKIKLKDLIEVSAAAKQAKAKGLKHVSFGNYADSSGKVVAQSKDGKLVPTKEPKEPSEKKAKKKKAKKKADMPADYEKNKADFKKKVKDKRDADFAKGDVGGPAHPNVPKGAKSSKDVEKKSKEKEKPKGPTRRDGESDADYKARSDKITKARKAKEKRSAANKKVAAKKKAERDTFKKVKVKDGGKIKPSKNNPWGKSDQGSTAVDASGEVPKYESQRKFSKKQHKKESDAEPVTSHDRGNGHFAGKNKDGNVQGFFGDDADIKADLYSRGESIDDKSIEKEKWRKEQSKKFAAKEFDKDGGASAWEDMMDEPKATKSWWEDMLDAFEKEAGEGKQKPGGGV